MVRRLDPAFILNLDDLPKVAEADGVVYPIFLRVRDVARLFNVEPETARRWVEENDLPVVILNRFPYVEVGAFNDWVASHSYTASEYEQYWRDIRQRTQMKKARSKAEAEAQQDERLVAWGDEED